MEKANEFLTDMLISKFNRIMDGLDANDSVENMEEELKKHDLLRRDVTNLVSSITPYLPYSGFLSGGITVEKHVSNHMYNKASNNSVGDEENIAKET